MKELLKLGSIKDFPKSLTIHRDDMDLADSIMKPIMLKAQLIHQIKQIPKQAFENTEGLKIFYNLFSLLNMIDEWIKSNYRWDEENESGLKSTKRMLRMIRKDLEKRLKMKIPMNTIFKDKPRKVSEITNELLGDFIKEEILDRERKLNNNKSEPIIEKTKELKKSQNTRESARKLLDIKNSNDLKDSIGKNKTLRFDSNTGELVIEDFNEVVHSNDGIVVDSIYKDGFFCHRMVA